MPSRSCFPTTTPTATTRRPGRAWRTAGVAPSRAARPEAGGASFAPARALIWPSGRGAPPRSERYEAYDEDPRRILNARAGRPPPVSARGDRHTRHRRPGRSAWLSQGAGILGRHGRHLRPRPRAHPRGPPSRPDFGQGHLPGVRAPGHAAVPGPPGRPARAAVATAGPASATEPRGPPEEKRRPPLLPADRSGPAPHGGGLGPQAWPAPGRSDPASDQPGQNRRTRHPGPARRRRRPPGLSSDPCRCRCRPGPSRAG